MDLITTKDSEKLSNSDVISAIEATVAIVTNRVGDRFRKHEADTVKPDKIIIVNVWYITYGKAVAHYVPIDETDNVEDFRNNLKQRLMELQITIEDNMRRYANEYLEFDVNVQKEEKFLRMDGSGLEYKPVIILDTISMII